MHSSKYERRGVSATKDEVHAAIKDLDKGLYPLAFCKVLPDISGKDPDYCNIMHADTAGTKTSLAYLYWKQTGQDWVWSSIAQDALVMNLDDMACVGCTSDIIVSSTIGRNKNLIPGEVIQAIIRGTTEFLDKLRDLGISIHLAGGETADVGDIVRTVDVGFTTFSRMRRADVIVNDIREGDVIIALASDGQTTYEDRYNSGIGSNGLTAARHDVLSFYYATHYPDSYDHHTPKDLVFTGPHLLTDPFPGMEDMDIGTALLSPTRTYLPVLSEIYRFFSSQIHGVIHCSGGGQTKVMKFLEGRQVIKDNLMPIAPVFRMIQSASGTSWQEMYQVFNMGHRLELYVPQDLSGEILDIAASFALQAQVVGSVKRSEKNEVVLITPEGTFTYQ